MFNYAWFTNFFSQSASRKLTTYYTKNSLFKPFGILPVCLQHFYHTTMWRLNNIAQLILSVIQRTMIFFAFAKLFRNFSVPEYLRCTTTTTDQYCSMYTVYWYINWYQNFLWGRCYKLVSAESNKENRLFQIGMSPGHFTVTDSDIYIQGCMW